MGPVESNTSECTISLTSTSEKEGGGKAGGERERERAREERDKHGPSAMQVRSRVGLTCQGWEPVIQSSRKAA